MQCGGCGTEVAAERMVFSPSGEQICQSCSLKMADQYRGSDTALRAWGCAILVAGGLGAALASFAGMSWVLGALAGGIIAGAIRTAYVNKKANQ